ncbi:MAG: hypothetical protein RL318_2837, partial [Fibrobacterota bacterium]
MKKTTALGILALSLSAQAATLSGTVKSTDGAALPEVTVRLAVAGATTTSDARGNWSMDIGTGISPRARAMAKALQNLKIENGHLRLSFGGHSINGSRTNRSNLAAQSIGPVAARKSLALDTLLLTKTGWNTVRLVLDSLGGIHDAVMAQPTVVPSLFVVGTDYSNYAIQRVQGQSLSDVGTEDASGGGVALDVADSVLYIINQKSAVITAFKGGIQDQEHYVFQTSVGAGTNPYQVAKAGNKLFVVRWETNNLLVLNATTGDSIGSIDLSAWANSEGKVKASAITFEGGHLWILAQGTRSDYSYDTGRVILADTNATKASSAIKLGLLNPQAMAFLNAKLYVVSHGTWDTASNGGIEVIDMATHTLEKNLTGKLGTNKPYGLVAVNGKLWSVVHRDAYGMTSEAATVDLVTGA